MKILFLTPDFSGYKSECPDAMMRALEKYSELVFYGPGFPAYDGNKNILEVIPRIYEGGKPDVIIMWDPEDGGWIGMENLDRVDCLKVLWSIDVHKDAVPWVFDYIKSSGIGLILMTYDRSLKSEAGRLFKTTGVPIEFYPFSVNPYLFKPMNLPKKYDVSLIGTMPSSYYPLRNQFHRILSGQKNLRYHHPGIKMYYREKFPIHINESKICVTCSSSYKYPLLKYLEVMACSVLLMADVPMDAEFLHFVPDYNFVEINGGNLMSKVNYYLEHEDEARRIAGNGRETILRYHTHDIRAKELIEKLSRYA